MPFSKQAITIALLVSSSIAVSAQDKIAEELKEGGFFAEQKKMLKQYQSQKASKELLSGMLPEHLKKDQPKNDGGDFIDAQEKGLEGLKKKYGDQDFGGKENSGNTALPRNFIEQQQAIVDDYKKKMQQDGTVEMFDKKTVDRQREKFANAAKLMASQSQQGMVNQLKQEMGVSNEFTDTFDPNKLDNPVNIRAMFISFNMPTNQIEEAMKIAVRRNMQLYLNGIHPDDQGIDDTVRRLHMIGADLDAKPDVRFKPRYFDAYGVQTAPTLLYKDEEGEALASGIMNIGWLESKVKAGETGFVGVHGDTVEVFEQDIREVFRERFEAYNFEGKRDKVVNNFWKKSDFRALPPAEKSEQWYIDVRGRAAKDVVNPRGDKLASKGQVLNPLANMTVPLTLYIFDPMDTKQIEWATNTSSKAPAKGKSMMIFSRIDRSKGWEHLKALRQNFGKEVYQLPKEMIETFKITHLPVRVTTDLDKNLLYVEQFDVREEGSE